MSESIFSALALTASYCCFFSLNWHTRLYLLLWASASANRAGTSVFSGLFDSYRFNQSSAFALRFSKSAFSDSIPATIALYVSAILVSAALCSATACSYAALAAATLSAYTFEVSTALAFSASIRPGIAAICSIRCANIARTDFAFSINCALVFWRSINAVTSTGAAYFSTSPGANCFSMDSYRAANVLTSRFTPVRSAFIVVTVSSISSILFRTFSGNRDLTTAICLRRPSAVSDQRENSTASKS